MICISTWDFFLSTFFLTTAIYMQFLSLSTVRPNMAYADNSNMTINSLWDTRWNEECGLKLLTSSNVCRLFPWLFSKTVAQLFVDSPGCDEKHSAMAAPWVQLEVWFIEIHWRSVLSHQLCGESQTDTSQLLCCFHSITIIILSDISLYFLWSEWEHLLIQQSHKLWHFHAYKCNSLHWLKRANSRKRLCWQSVGFIFS